MTARYLERRYWYKGHNSIPKAEATVALKINRSSSQKRAVHRFRVCFFACLPQAGFFFEQAKKNTNTKNAMKQYYPKSRIVIELFE